MPISQLFTRLKPWFTKALFGSLFLGVSGRVLLYNTTANAAEQVILKYGSFRGTVSVKELSQFVETGETTVMLEAYLQAARQDPPLVRQAFTAGIKADPEFLDNLLSSWAGPILLNQVGEVVHPPFEQSDQQALRSAMSQSIYQDGEVTLLKAIQKYPTKSVEIEGDRLIAVYQRLSLLAKSF